MRNLEISNTPIDYFYNLGEIANAEVQTDDNQYFHIKADNEICKGFSELLQCNLGSFAISTTCFLHKGFSILNTYNYDQNWLYGLILLDGEKSSLCLARFKSSKQDKNSEAGFELINTKGVIWKQEDNSSYNKIILYFSDEWLKQTLEFIPNVEENNWKYLRNTLKGRTFYQFERENSITQLTTKILPLVEYRDLKSIISKKTMINELMHEIIYIIFGNDVLTDNMFEDDLKGLILARNELIKNFRNPVLSLDELSKISGMNRLKFQLKFKEYFKKSFYQYYQEKRFEYAKTLIVEKGYLVSQAAYAINYLHLGHFSQTFKKIFGVSPSEIKTKL